MFGDPHFWEKALMWATGQDQERDRAEAEAKRRREKEEREARGNGLPEGSFAERLRRYGNPDRSLLEDRRGEAVTQDSAGFEVPVGVPNGRPHGSGSVLDPRWTGPDHRLRPNLPPEVLRDLVEADEWTRLREEREDLIDGEYEPTRSPLVLRKRLANGSVTYVHAMTGQELFDLGEYGLNDPQGAEKENPWDPVYDPYWRAGRREW